MKVEFIRAYSRAQIQSFIFIPNLLAETDSIQFPALMTQFIQSMLQEFQNMKNLLSGILLAKHYSLFFTNGTFK